MVYSKSTSSTRFTRLAALVVIVHALMLAWSAHRQSPTEDEIGHLVAGIQHWQTCWFDLYRVNPPLVRMVAAVPVILANPQTPEKKRFNFALVPRNEFRLGAEFISGNGERSFWLFTLARWACIPFSLLGAYVCYRWGTELYGAPAGLLALVLWCFSSNIIAHGQLITPDVGATAVGASAAYLFWRWLKRPTWPRTLAAGVVLGLAELTKMTWIVLFVFWPLLWLVWRWAERRNVSRREWCRQVGQLIAMLVLAVQVVNLGYGFEGSFQRLDRYTFLSSLFSENKPPANLSASLSGGRDSMGNRFAGTALGAVPVPLPSNYLQGIDRQKWDFERRQWSYLRGEWRTQGWWYYYVYGLAVKLPLGTWFLLLLTLSAALGRWGYSSPWRDQLVLLAPAAAVLILVSSETGFNHHLRYVLPIFPFIFIWVGQLARATVLRHRRIAWFAVAALTWSVGSSLWIYPHSLSYFNELTGGPRAGHAHLLDSNIDWGQDLLYLKRWLEEHPEAQPLGLAYSLDVDTPYLLVDPGTAGIEYTIPPVGPPSEGYDPSIMADPLGPLPGWYAISVRVTHSRTKRYSYFQEFEPAAMAGYSISIYHITSDEANRVRRDLGLPELPGPRRPGAGADDRPPQAANP